MKVAILGANGKAGSAILKEAKKRGLEVTAIVRNKEKITDDTPVIEKDVYQLTSEDIKNFDVLVSALGFWGDVNEFAGSTQHLIDILTNQATRLLVVGGAGSLYVNPEHTVRLSETPDFPADFKPLATAMGKGLNLLENAENIHWTYLSPAADFDAEGTVTGGYVTAGEELALDAEGKSYISYGDYAIAMVDEIQNQAHPNQRFSVHQ
jgi:putative NADH-flavin reductase